MTIAFINKEKILSEIRQGNEDALVRIYLKYKSEFIRWGSKTFNLSQEECEDIYQDSILIFRKNIVSEKLVELNSSIKTYLFAVARNIALKRIQTSARHISENLIGKEKEQNPHFAEPADEIIARDEQQQLISNMINKLNEPNRSILKMYYYQNLSMKEIAEKLNYKNDKVVKAQKVRCMKTLKKMVQELSLMDTLED